jgi:replicative DNA helicase
MEVYNRINEKYLKILEDLDNENYEVDQEIFDLEDEIKEALEYTTDEEYENLLELVDELKSTKREYGFYVEEDELDNMFPDRHDEDFDEDDIN